MHVEDYENDIEYIQSRLNGTIVMIAGEPGYINGIYNGDIDGPHDCMYVEYQPMSGVNKYKTAPLHEVDINPIKLGYCNVNNDTTYVTRMPARYWKQGTCRDNIFCSPFVIDLFSPYMHDTILNKYPKPIDALEGVFNKENRATAFSRSFAFGFHKAMDKPVIMYRNDTVGEVSWNGESEKLNYHLFEKNLYLHELLEEATYNV